MNNNKYFILFLCLIFSCKASKNNSTENVSLLTIDDASVPVEEFIYVYSKNNFNNDSAFNEQDIKDYLDLYVNFKLKVREAEESGIHETEAFKEELEGYRKQLAKPYLTEGGVTDELVKEAYERLKTEINAAHILMSLPSEAEPEDTLAVYKKLMEIRARALKGEDFGKLAKAHSNDPSANVNGGDLGYFTALQMVYPFEDAAYKTEEGAISYPVRTRFGYHILLIKDKRPSQGRVKVSHIMVRATQGISAEDSIAARNEIYEIYKQLQTGADWFEMANQYSDDISSKSSGGALPWFSTGNMIPEFEAVAFSLDKPGAFSEPLKTVYGWHIIKLDEKQGLESFEVLEPTLKMKVTKDSRAELNKVALIKRLKVENNFQKFDEVVGAATSEIDSTLVLGKWSYSSENQLLGESLFSINNESYPVKDFYDYVAENQRQQQNLTASQYIKMLYEQFEESALIAYEEAHLADKYEDYRMLLKEYRDGILLFELMDKKVWSKAVEDSVGLLNFYEENKNNYQWEERAKATIFNTSSRQVLDSLKKITQGSGFKNEKSFTISGSGDELTAENKAILDSLATILLKDELLRAELTKSSDAFAKTIINYLAKKGVAEQSMTVAEGISDSDHSTINVRSTTLASLEKAFNQKNALTLKAEEGLFEKKELPVFSKIAWAPGKYEVEEDGRYSYVIIEKILPASQKKFDEIRGQVISDYQNHLEKQWVQNLKSKYVVNINDDALEKVFEQLENN